MHAQLVLNKQLGTERWVKNRTRSQIHRSRREERDGYEQVEHEVKCRTHNRRNILLGALALDLAVSKAPAHAIQGLTAGRVPGLSTTDTEGFRTYARPEGKSGGHGIGWSEIPQYTFRVPDGWVEEAVSIADLGGTEIDVRFENKEQGQLAVVVAPVLRFMNVGFNADVRIQDIGAPEKVLNGFAPEILGGPVEDEDVVVMDTMDKGDLTYYMWETKYHDLLTATAFKNRVFIIALRASARQWRNSKDDLRIIQKSFEVSTA